MTYNVFGGTLSLTQSINQSTSELPEALFFNTPRNHAKYKNDKQSNRKTAFNI